MRITAIRGRNLASLSGDFALELDRAPLGTAGVFAITGPVGAGKTTVLDAMCVALFDRTPRLTGRGGAQVGGDAAVNDARCLLRRGAVDARAQVDFIGRDGRAWQATWSVRRSRDRLDGKLQAQTIELRDVQTGVVHAGPKTEVLGRIRAALGLDWDQFRRSVLLAQGDFAAFLNAPAPERAELLERMTGTEVYARLSRAAHERYAAEQEAMALLDAEWAGVATVDASEREALRVATADATLEMEVSNRVVDEARAAVAWHLEQVARQTAWRGACAAAEALREESAHAEADRLALNVADFEAPLRSAAQAADQAFDERIEADGSVAADAASVSSLTARSPALGAGLGAARAAALTARAAREALAHEIVRARAADHRAAAAAENQRVAETAHLVAAKEALSAQSEVEPLLLAIDKGTRTSVEAERWLALHVGLRPLALQWGRWQDELKRHTAATRELARDARPARQAATALANARTAEAIARAGAPAVTADVLEADRAERAAELDRLKSGLTLFRACEAADVERSSADLARAVAAGEASAAAELEDRLERRRQTNDATLDEATRTLARLEAKEALAARRDVLVDGEPCPLCGSREHPVEAISPWSDIVQDQRGRVAALRQQGALLASEAEDAAVRRQVASAASAAAEQRAARARTCLDEARASWLALDLGPVPADPRERIAGVRVRIDDLKRALSALAELAKAELTVERATHAVAVHEAARQAREAVQAAALAAVASAFAGWIGWERDQLVDPDGFAKLCQKQVEVWLATDARAARSREHLAGLAADLRVAAMRRADAVERASRLASEADRAAAALVEALAARASLLGGRSADEVEREDRVACDRAQADLDEAAQAVADHERALATATERLEASRRRLREASARYNVAVGERDDQLAAAGVTLHALRALPAVDDAWRSATRARLTALAGAVAVADADERSHARRLAEHEASLVWKLRGVDAPAAEAALALAVVRQEAARERRLELETRLRADEHALSRRAELEPRRTAQRDRSELWKGMADLIGSHDGRKLRVFAQGLTLDALLGSANQHLASLAPRYRLARVPGLDLDLQIVDRDLADEVRGVNGLSGGETFLVSLALALALSSFVGSGADIGSLFVDEGFGTLDPESLDVALAALDALQATGRQVGLVSHVPGLAERVGVEVRVIPQGVGQSSLVVGTA